MQRTESVPEHVRNAYVLNDPANSAVSWGAVIAGAIIGAALTATLITGGTGLGFLTVSPWDDDGASGTAIAFGTIVWLFLTQIVAYGIAGYVTGRRKSAIEGEISPEDQDYLVKLISQRAGISETDANARLSQITENAKRTAEEFQMKARETADDARKITATFSLWAFASLLLGAFVASFSATIGGRARDF